MSQIIKSELVLKQLTLKYPLNDLFNNSKFKRFIDAISEGKNISFDDFVDRIGFSSAQLNKFKREDFIKELKTLNAIAETFYLAFCDYGNSTLKSEILDKLEPENFQEMYSKFLEFISKDRVFFWKKNSFVVNEYLQVFLPEKYKEDVAKIFISIFYRLTPCSFTKLVLDGSYPNASLSEYKFLSGEELTSDEQAYILCLLACNIPLGSVINCKYDVEYLSDLDLIILPTKHMTMFKLFSYLDDTQDIDLDFKEFNYLYSSKKLEQLRISDGKFFLGEIPLRDYLNSML